MAGSARIEDLRAEARYRRERYELYRARVYGGRPTTMARLRGVAAGRSSGLEVADLVTAMTRATGLDGEAVRNVRVLERFPFLEVPVSDVSEVLERVNGTEVRGTPLRLERAAG